MAKRPMFAVGLSSFLTALVCVHLSVTAMASVVALSAAVLSVSFFFRPKTVAKGLVFCAVGVLTVSAAFLLKQVWTVHRQIAYGGQTVRVMMCVKEILPSEQGYIVRVTDGDVQEGTRLWLEIPRRDIRPQEGELLEATLKLTPAFEKDTFEDAMYAKMNNTYLRARLASDSAVVWERDADGLSFPERLLVNTRMYIRNALYAVMDADSAALCEGVLLGDRDGIDEHTEWEFRASGVYHLLAVSGQHLSMLVGVLYWLLDRARIRHRKGAVVGMLISVLFTALCAFSPSVTRACVMTVAALAGCLFRRRPDGINSLGLAAWVMLMADPFVIYDLGFQLSLASTFGIVLMYPVWHQELVLPITAKTPRWLRGCVKMILSGVGLTLTATLFTQPFTAVYFGELSLVFLPANVICVPLSSVLLVLCLVFAALYALLPPAAQWCAIGMDMLCGGMTATTALLSATPVATVSVRAAFAVVWVFLLAVLIPVGYRLMKKRGVALVAVGMAVVLLAAICVRTWLYRDVTTVVTVASASPTFIVKTDTGCGAVFKGDSATLKRLEETLHRENVRNLDWLLWLESPHTAVDTSQMNVSIDRLVLSEPLEMYRSLPACKQITTLRENGMLRFDRNKALTEHGTYYRVDIGKTAILVMTEGSRLNQLPDEWDAPSLLLIEGVAPDGIEDVKAPYISVFCEYRNMDKAELSLPHTFKNVYMVGRDDVPAFFTFGEGDISLRTDE